MCSSDLEIQSVQTTNKKFTVLHNVTNMSEIMAKHQIAISAGGNTLFELLTVGVPTLIVCGEKHELEIANLINKQNYAINLGYGPTISKNIIAKNVENLLNNLDLRRTFNKNTKKIFDGNGLTRLCDLIISKL